MDTIGRDRLIYYFGKHKGFGVMKNEYWEGDVRGIKTDKSPEGRHT